MDRIIKVRRGIILLGIMCIAVMFGIDYIIQPEYQEKSLFKILVFLLIPLLYTRLNKHINFRDFLKIGSKGQILGSLLLGAIIYGLILGTYFVLRDFIDLNNIKNILAENLKVTKENFIFVSLYISFFNSLLEEFFFRGFLFLGLKKLGNTVNAYFISALFFAIYHVAIMASWFSISLFVLAMLGLFIGALIFNWLNEKSENIYNSWLVHMFANFAINTVGFIMFG